MSKEQPTFGLRPSSHRRALAMSLAALAALPASAQVSTPEPAAQAAPPESAASAPRTVYQLDTVRVPGKRLIDVSPLPGLAITKDQIPANIQSATKEQIKASRALNIGDYMNTQMQGVSVNDYSGNPFQMDVNYRGFTASPQVGTPQGLSVFFDGVRVNEPFGDVVNWDLIPVNAIERFDLFPGSNPLFGLNTLGGAISVRSKSGFTAPGFDGSVLGGSWGRRQVQLSGGGNDGSFAGFAALNLFDEDGWRDNSPSKVRQFYGRADWALPQATLTASVLASNNDLIGNGLIPIQLYEQRPEAVFTSPDQAKNKLLQFALSGAFDVSPTMNITGKIYRRKSDHTGVNGDAYEDFQDLGPNDVVSDWKRVNPSLPICQFAALNASGSVNINAPLNGPVGSGCDFVHYAPSPYSGQPRNGGYLNSSGVQQPGVVDGGTPIGLLTSTQLEQVTDGAGVQFNWNLERHKFMLGASLDRSRANYLMSQRLGLIDASHQVDLSPDNIAPIFAAAFTDVVGNSFDGKEKTGSLYFDEVWSPRDNLHLTFAGRYNRTQVNTNIGTRARIAGDLGDVQGSLPTFIICPSSDPATCPSAPVAVLSTASTQQTPTHDDLSYRSFNPSFGVNWLPTPELNLFGNLSRGARVPSVVELGCAFDQTFTLFDPNNPALGGTARSLTGPTCSLPTTLSGDPYLPQIRATSGELGARGLLARGWEWNASVYRTDLTDDIYYVGVGSGRSYFDTIGKTRRQGLELGVKGRTGPVDVSASYSFVDASFQSTFYMVSPNNSSADFDQNSRTLAGDPFFFRGSPTLLPSANASLNRGYGTFEMIRVDPGARMPGIAAHNFNSTVAWHVLPEWRVGLTMIARSNSYMRGNENNQHQASGTDQQTGQYYCTSGDCVTTGYLQIPVAAGRPFTQSGKVPGYAVFNFDTSVEVRKGLQVNLLVTNLLGRTYFTAGRLGLNPFSPSVVGAVGPSGWNYNSSEWQNTSFVGPGSPRAFWLSLNYTMDPT